MARTGTYVIPKIPGKSYRAYIPPALPPDPPIDLSKLHTSLEKASFAISELNNLIKSMPTPEFFTHLFMRKEALLSSHIAGVSSTFLDLMLFENHKKNDAALENTHAVSQHVKSVRHGLAQLNNRIPLSLELLKTLHGILLSKNTKETTPSAFRTSQNWIGGDKPENALFIPPPPEYMKACLSDFENFLQNKTLPPLIRIGIAHAQFETIHPFPDGNGRLGRLLVTLMLCTENILNAPILYISLYFKQRKEVYNDLLQQVRSQGKWEEWLAFFLEGICDAAKDATSTIQAINTLFENDLKKIASLGRARFSCQQTLEYLKELPQISVPQLSTALQLTHPTARSALNRMVDLDILAEVSGKERDKIYVYQKYLDLLEAH